MGGMENNLVNLINRMPPARFRHAIACVEDFSDFRSRVEFEVRSAFLDVLSGAGIPFGIRYSGGQDVAAGCGQLAAGGGRWGARL